MDTIEVATSPSEPTILDMLEQGIRQAWEEKRWGDVVDLTKQFRKCSAVSAPAIRPEALRLTQLEQHVERLRKEHEKDHAERMAQLARITQKLDFLTNVLEQTPDGGRK